MAQNSILPTYNNTKQTQKRSNELKIVRGRLLSSKNGSNEQIMNIHLCCCYLDLEGVLPI